MTLGPLMVDLAGTSLLPEERELLADPLVGGVILFTRNYGDRGQLAALTAAIRAARTPPLLIAVDQEGGRVQRFRDGFSALPPLRALGHLHDDDPDRARHAAFDAAWVMAAELLDAGIDLSFAPVVDLDWGVSSIIGDRAFHPDPGTVATLALSWMQGMRRAGMAAVAKHFPGHGAVRADSHLELPEDHRGPAQLEDDLAPYVRLIEHGLPGVMVAHVRYPRIDPEVASLSRWWISTELRGRLRFEGAVFSDDLSMEGAAVAGTVPERVARALAAGVDMALVCNNRPAVAATLEALRGFGDPVRAARLVALRGRPGDRPAEGALRESVRWRQATAVLAELAGPPPLELRG